MVRSRVSEKAPTSADQALPGRGRLIGADVPHYTVTCTCGRPMQTPRSAPAGYFRCQCGNKIQVNDHLGENCVFPYAGNHYCRLPLLVKEPIALCGMHAKQLANARGFRDNIVKHPDVVFEEMLARRDEHVHLQQQSIFKLAAAHSAEQSRIRSAKGHVYYIRLRGCIKIGFTINMKARMGQLMPDKILATEPGTRKLEARRHKQFDKLRADIGREYFKPESDLMDHIAAVRKEHGEPAMTDWADRNRVVSVMTIEDAAKIANVNIRTLYRWVEEERLTTSYDHSIRANMVDVREVRELMAIAAKTPRKRMPSLPDMPDTG